MRRRIVEAIIGVAATILIALGLPLAIAVHRTIVDSEVVELQAAAAHLLIEIDVPLDHAQLVRVQAESDAPSPFSIYDPQGVLLFGDGTAAADPSVRRALAGSTASNTQGKITVATPITDRSSERIVGVLRVTESLAEADRRARTAWLWMLLAGLLALGLGWIIAHRLARQLARPLTDLVTAAENLDEGGAFTHTPVSGFVEIDTLAHAFVQSSQRTSEALARERRFTADVSHQLRTPLARLRLRLESPRGGEPESARTALDDLSHIEQTIDHLLAFARDAMPVTSTVDLDRAARQAVSRWADRAAADGRLLRVTSMHQLTTRGAASSVDQVLDVLLDNALHHGRGVITLGVRHLAGGGAIDVTDEGAGIPAGAEELIFERGYGRTNGIGLALARSIAEAEGGRLLLVQARPARLSLILLGLDESNAP